jgi:ectoine hydroxylase-related dioxygenase (phytanoyl-CoA dioxygenase family)
MPGLRRQFEESGYCVVRGAFPPASVVQLEAEFDRIVRQVLASGEEANARWSGPEMERMGAASTTVLHTHNVQQYSAVWMRALLSPGFLEPAVELLGPDVVLHHTKLFQKPAETGAPFPMHQDWGYFPTVRDTMIAGVVHVSRASDEMGCLRVYPGSHKLGRLEEAMGGTEALLRTHPIEGATPLEAEPGDVVFFHYLLVHGSLPNRSEHVRKTVLVQIHSGNDEVVPGCTHPNERLCLAGWNHKATRGTANLG